MNALTVIQIAKKYGVSRQTIYEWTKKGLEYSMTRKHQEGRGRKIIYEEHLEDFVLAKRMSSDGFSIKEMWLMESIKKFIYLSGYIIIEITNETASKYFRTSFPSAKSVRYILWIDQKSENIEILQEVILEHKMMSRGIGILDFFRGFAKCPSRLISLPKVTEG